MFYSKGAEPVGRPGQIARCGFREPHKEHDPIEHDRPNRSSERHDLCFILLHCCADECW